MATPSTPGDEDLVRIKITGIRAFGCHGVLPQEKTTPQPFVVDVSIQVDWSGRDQLIDSVNYAEVANRVAKVITTESFDLIETLAAHLADVVLQLDRVCATEICVHKPQAPIGIAVSDVSVTIRRRKQ